jgi:aldose sugar dehydrogenase
MVRGQAPGGLGLTTRLASRGDFRIVAGSPVDGAIAMPVPPRSAVLAVLLIAGTLAACSKPELPPAAGTTAAQGTIERPTASALAGPAAVAGEWRGQYEIPGGSILLVLRLGVDEAGELTGEADFPAPGRMNNPLAGLAYADGQLSATLPNGAELRLAHSPAQRRLTGELLTPDGASRPVELALAEQWLAERELKSELAAITLATVAEGLAHPWGLAFLPDGRFLVTERVGQLRIVSRDGGISAPLAGVPAVVAAGQGGMLDVALSPDFAESGLVYLSYAEPGEGGSANAVARAVLRDDALHDLEVLFRATPTSAVPVHFGSRLVFTPDGYLFVTLGDRGTGHQQDDAQRLDSHPGTVLRVLPDGGIPPDNPFVSDPLALDEIWSYGHRNIQGAALHPGTGELWTHEHGPQGGDEINITRAGRNYGWPVITYGERYGGGFIGPAEQAGMEQPFYEWTPSIAPSGMAFFDGAGIPAWRGQLLVGSLRFNQLVRLELGADGVTHEERIPIGMRVRDVREGPDGAVYLLTDHPQGKLLRLTESSR